MLSWYNFSERNVLSDICRRREGFEDLQAVQELSGGKVDLTIGSAFDLFGGDRVRYRDCVAWNRAAN